MAFKRQARFAERKRRLRDAFAIANLRLPVSARPRASLVPVRPSRSLALRTIEDRRTFHPSGAQRAAAGYRYPRHRLVVVETPGSGLSVPDPFSIPAIPIGVGFAAPNQVAICIRRKTRREVIFARGKAGRGVRRRKPRFNYYSDVRC